MQGACQGFRFVKKGVLSAVSMSYRHERDDLEGQSPLDGEQERTECAFLSAVLFKSAQDGFRELFAQLY
jgi:hypothetical protein